MKENVLDVLMYLFENYMDDGSEMGTDQATLTTELSEAGFPRGEVNKAFSWLESLSALRESERTALPAPHAQSLRCYAPEELKRLTPALRGYLYFLESQGVLDPLTRELVIDRVMALDASDIDLEQLKWIVLLVLFHQPGQEQAFAWMEGVVYDGAPEFLH